MSTHGIRTHLAEAERARQQGRADEARSHLEAVLTIDPGDPTARNLLGADAMQRNDVRSAAAHFDAACKAQPREPGHWINLATAHRLLGDGDAERAALEQALGLDQTDLLALIRLAQLHERQGEDAPAASRWAAVLALSSGIANPAPEFAQVLGHAKRFVGDQRKRLLDAVDGALAEDLSEASVRDRRRMRVAADAWLGRRAIYQNQCEGLHYPFLPADEYFDRELFPWIEDLEAATDAIVEELQAILSDRDPGLAPYIAMAPGTPPSKWTKLDGSLDWGAFHLWKEGVRFDDDCARAPRTAEIIEALPPMCRIEGRAPNAFFSILKAGAHIPAHTGVTNVRSVLHLPLIVPDGCEFRVGGETRAWRRGEAFVFDDTIEHEAWNRSGEDRAVLIVDVWNPHLSEHERAMIERFYATANAQLGVLP